MGFLDRLLKRDPPLIKDPKSQEDVDINLVWNFLGAHQDDVRTEVKKHYLAPDTSPEEMASFIIGTIQTLLPEIKSASDGMHSLQGYSSGGIADLVMIAMREMDITHPSKRFATLKRQPNPKPPGKGSREA